MVGGGEGCGEIDDDMEVVTSPTAEEEAEETTDGMKEGGW